jgi:hypothetical protein
MLNDFARYSVNRPDMCALTAPVIIGVSERAESFKFSNPTRCAPRAVSDWHNVTSSAPTEFRPHTEGAIYGPFEAPVSLGARADETRIDRSGSVNLTRVQKMDNAKRDDAVLITRASSLTCRAGARRGQAAEIVPLDNSATINPAFSDGGWSCLQDFLG